MTFVPSLVELRSFLHLGARGKDDGVLSPDIERQEHTVLRALEVLRARPGVILADEVGMGKTFEALGVVAAFRHADPKSRVVILTPGPDLNDKWVSELQRFREPGRCVYDFGLQYRPAKGGGAAADPPAIGPSCRTLAELVERLKTTPIVVAPITAFGSAGGVADRSYLLSLFFHWRESHGNVVNAALARLTAATGKPHERVDVHERRFLDTFPLERIQRHLTSAFGGGRDHRDDALGPLHDAMGQDLFSDAALVKRALELAKFRLVRALISDIDLLVVDEAHKLKNADGVRVRGVLTAFHRKFDKALFLTATPFQLDVGELRQVFRLFEHAKDPGPPWNGGETWPEVVRRDADGLLAQVRDYQGACDDLQGAWSRLDAVGAAAFRAYYEAHGESGTPPDDPELVPVAERARGVLALKNKLEPLFRQWMIRSLREEKRVYRDHTVPPMRPVGTGAIPFLIYERMIAELFRTGVGTHKAAVEVNLVSSFGAARTGALLSDDAKALNPSVVEYRELLKEVLEVTEPPAKHPKLEWVLDDALDAAERGEKTLIFCARTETIRELGREANLRWRERLLQRWRRSLPGATHDDVFGSARARTEHTAPELEEDAEDGDHTRGRHSLLRARFRSQSVLYLGLRERYLRTLVPAAGFADGHFHAIVERANELLREVRTSKNSAERVDYRILKRCVERATVEGWHRGRTPTASKPSRLMQSATDAILDPRFVALGLDLERDTREGDGEGDATPSWTITRGMVGLVIGGEHNLWTYLSGDLARFVDLRLRVAVVEEIARFLLYPDVPFVADLVLAATEAGISIDAFDSREMLALVDGYWETEPGQRWITRISEYLRYLWRRGTDEQEFLLSGPLSRPQLARHTLDGDTRERLREAFNTPLYPMILVANEVMQEGIDLHRSCARLVHHDLAWNPAALEQRVGRIDRLGSLTAVRRQDSPNAKLAVLYPLIPRTIDVRIHRTVRAREKWLEFLLGATPKFEEYSFDEDAPQALPAALAASLAIDLRPHVTS